MVLIGIDGGASKISAWEVLFNENTDSFSLGTTNFIREYRNYEGYIENYKPVELAVQLSEMKGDIKLTDEELRQGKVYIRACADVLIDFSKKFKGEKLVVGIGMPGLKSADKRGIVALANGPRMPLYADMVEKILSDEKVELYSKIAVLGSDADYCGIGEEFSMDGEFKNAKNAYYLGGGTGVADALKLESNLIAFDNIKDWIPKTWELKSDDGLSMERYTSASGIQFIYSKNSGIEVDDLSKNGIFPTQILMKAINGEEFAIKTITEVSKNIATIVFEQISTLYFGWLNQFEFVNPNKTIELKDHPFIKTKLEKIIVGQRLGDLFAESVGTGLLFDQFIESISSLINKVDDKDFKDHYLPDNKFNSELIKFSRLREAPALGAAVDAFNKNFK